MKKLIAIYFLFTTAILFAQYPKDYFRSPLDIPINLSGTFGELRTNHFHSGLDIRTNNVEGLPVYAAADGYVSRIKVSVLVMVKPFTLHIPTDILLFMDIYRNMKER